ncbi:MAG: Crp/Fnr family transcriptional regulator [Phocaeicola sp.]|uniref:Crp/Fnr family transcriptional regulator n=1 Tax=Phocaeicola TaxID=909656 RepID=UPI00234F5087|nr:Crp/Fnr family transcriptional regulator [Phocaeicola oris]MCE2615664.1 Crp/Fnr family transcriptional regulator [Phocaeicola oris]
MESSMYDTLLQLPLFQGLGKTDLTNILSKVKLSFHTYAPEETIVKQGDKCEELMFFLSGQLVAETEHADGNYTFSEVFLKPMVIEPYSLFGLHPNYHSTYKARHEVRMLIINKKYMLTELNHYEIFRINYLNILSNQVQNEHNKLHKVYTTGIRKKIINFLAIQALKPEGEKSIRIKMEDLANIIDETRINVSRELNDMQDKGLIELKRKSIIIPALEKLINAN